IQYLISCNEQKSALDYMSKFASLLRLSLDNSLKSTISIEEEVKFLCLYLELEKFRFDDRFEYTVQVQPGIDVENTKIPVMCIQPFVENAVVHGLGNCKQKGNLKILFFREGGELLCEVEDNGLGINRS
ncbi:MAG: hypothetical protein GWN00_37540, partial [Aliifodinibius sp.]|nr:hypothetical protein [Fodinibius sp.]NIV16312.1 hypothetical protein [Fodinibius sp.]NIY30284.1 hypothetical protein [Fodinibius sp.]